MSSLSATWCSSRMAPLSVPPAQRRDRYRPPPLHHLAPSTSDATLLPRGSGQRRTDESSPLRQSRYSVSRGAITTAGSSVAGLSVPVTTPNSPLYNLSAVPVYYTDAATQQRASITNLPLTPILSSPNTKKSTARNPSTLPDVARRPFSSDADEALAGQYLSDFTAKAYGKKFTNKKSFF